MTETTTIQTGQETTCSIYPTDILMALIVAFLVPMFLPVSGGNVNYARLAAIETVNAYRVRNHADLLAIAQIIAFGLAALGSLSLSMADDISLSLTLRLRGNANALNRSAEQNRRALTKSVSADPVPQEQETPTAIVDDDLGNTELTAEPRSRDQTPIPTPAAAQATAEKRHQAMWAIAMVKEAGEITASIPNLPPAERRAAEIRAGALSACAAELLSGPQVAPRVFSPGGPAPPAPRPPGQSTPG